MSFRGVYVESVFGALRAFGSFLFCFSFFQACGKHSRDYLTEKLRFFLVAIIFGARSFIILLGNTHPRRRCRRRYGKSEVAEYTRNFTTSTHIHLRSGRIRSD